MSTGTSAAAATRRWLVTGASGFIGSRLIARAHAEGIPVRTFTRSGAGVPGVVPETERCLGSLPGNLPPAMLDGVDVVVHCAAWVGGPSADADAVNVDGTLRLAEAAAKAGARAFVFLSTQSARPDATSDYGRTKHAAEQALLARFADGPLAVVILRLGLVTGGGTRGFYRRLAAIAARWPVLPLVGADAPVQPLHVDDLAAAILEAGRRAEALRGRVLHLGSPDVLPLRRFLAALAVARSGRGKPVVAVPLAPLIAVARVAESLGVPFPVTAQNLAGARRAAAMDTRADMALLRLPERSLDELLRDDLAVDAATGREVERLGRYLVGRPPSPVLAARYARAVATLGLTIAPDETRAWHLALRAPRLLPIVDGGLALVKPHGTIRRRLHALLAVLEASPDHCDAFLPTEYGLGDRLVVAAVALRAGAAGALGFLLVRLLGVHSSR